MKKTFKSAIIISVILFMLLGILAPIFADTAADFEANPAKYETMCRGRIDEENKQICADYRQFLIDRASNNKDLANELAGDLEKIKSDIVSNLGRIQDYTNMIAEFEANIAQFELDIANKETAIAELEVQIKEREGTIKGIEDQVKAFMVNSQSTMRVNGYIEFVMGATDFADIVRRIEGMNNIKRYNEGLIEDLRVEREKLQTDQDLVVAEKDAIEDNKILIEAEKANTELVKVAAQQLQEQLVIQKVNLETQDAAIKEQIAVDEAAASAIVASGSFMNPVPGSQIGESVWHYSGSYGGGVHLGADLPAGVGTPIYAMGNGIVVVADGGCSTNGSWGCNGGLGNHMAMIFEVGGTIYGTLIGHMAQGSFLAGPGSIVDQGAQIGSVGNSGNSYGAHAHVEIFYLGDDSVSAALERWNSSQRTAQFGLGGSSGGTSSTCDARGGAIPCRLNPNDYLQ
ncbi:peptidoglycan DD-metalloendopeptidase family protein [Erysipelothrix sp. HDW6C]|uniref:murein hydrolase activator EnvC family protein n=1 Tax=Erysipelothrix sp. HDW6C TaxID=2714930 RepID=UPI0014094B76|nr:peptidoglycan DD-metalloendopeptidase family protein [Erysipelothrix sp. HDW6C]QIK68881.1 peptidoglycan DD-metalloendopeptidase family protein [Erysipelothrix sp. HDW6C]